MPNVAVLGSTSSHGGVVISASAQVVALGLGVAVSGDLHACPISGHGITPFLSSATTVVNGRGVVRAGLDSCGCGAVVVAGCPSVVAT